MVLTTPGLRVRRLPLDVEADVPKHWMWGSAWMTHTANGFNLLFPLGERFFVRSVRHYLDALGDDPELAARVKGFIGQEAQHGRAHELANDWLRRQGFELDTFLDWYARVAFGTIEPLAPPAFRLSVTVALEHLTATLAHQALTEGYLDEVHPAMKALLLWHACEEIEHKSVAFDVFEKVDGRWWVRIAGMAAAYALLLGFARSAARHLLAQDADATPGRLRRERHEAVARGRGPKAFRGALLAYLRPGFHPDGVDDRQLAADWLAVNGFAPAVAG